MELVFIHHGNRKFGNPRSQEDDITKLGEKDAKLVTELFATSKKKNIKAIYTSPFKRCLKTAQIINEKLKVPIKLESRFNEMKSVENETWVDFQNRNRAALKDIVYSHSDDDCVVCVMSGVNIVVFMQLVFNLPSSENAPFIKVPSCSPLIFNINKSNFIEP